MTLIPRKLLVKRLTSDAVLPRYAHQGDAGLDLFAAENAIIAPGEVARIGTGISIQLPRDTEGQVRPRSGLALNSKVTVLNAPGTIDEGYTGEVGVLLINHGRVSFEVVLGMKIAQLVVAPRVPVDVVEVECLDETTRGGGGFGSTGS